MYKKILSMLFIFTFVFTSLGQAYGGSSYLISMNDNRTLNINSLDFDDDIRVLVEKDDNKYYYSLMASDEVLPLQLGKGKYTIKILENVSGNRYKVLEKQTLNLDKFNEKDAFLVSAQPVVWEKDGQEVKLAEDLTKGLENDKDKIKAIYDYIVKNINYDYNKIKKLDNNYVPNNIDTLKTLSGICYDYSSLFAAMLRSLNIPTKLVKGYKNDISTYHAWNEVLINDNWVIIDTTYDSAFIKANQNISMLKSSNEYNKIREY
ncbi:MAG: transglutaminase-like domain-containing protein [Tissierellaceae bacterium]|nr:transglutaminase-like domain-containing protein [Tissierellaceae bacterium]